MLAALCVVLVPLMGFNWLVDPYGAWGGTSIGKIYLEVPIGQERVRTPYRLRSERPATLLVGSSRVLYGMPIEQGYRDGVFNAALSGVSLDEIAALIRLAVQAPTLKRIIWGVDFYAFSEEYQGFPNPETRSRLEGNPTLRVRETLLSAGALDDASAALRRRRRGRTELPPGWLERVPWSPASIREALANARPHHMEPVEREATRKHAESWLGTYLHYNDSATQIALFREIVARVEAAGVMPVLFVPPLSEHELEAIRQAGKWETFLRWKRTLAGIHPYWDFSGYHELARNDDLFWSINFCHFKPAVGEMILRHVLGEGCDGCGERSQLVRDAARWVTPENVEAHVAEQDAERIARLQDRSPQAQLVEDAARSLGITWAAR
jgi:hypothetical protein